MSEKARKRIRLQLMWDRLIAVVEEQAQAILKTAFGSVVREAGDLSTGIYDLQGRMLAQAVTGTPGHVNSMAKAVSHFLERFPVTSMQPGDVFVTNDPWMGTGHLFDFVVVSPAYYSGKETALFASTCHMIDVGGRGFSAEARSIYEEGVRIPHMKLRDGDRLNQIILSILEANSRNPVEVKGDLLSLITVGVAMAMAMVMGVTMCVITVAMSHAATCPLVVEHMQYLFAGCAPQVHCPIAPSRRDYILHATTVRYTHYLLPIVSLERCCTGHVLHSCIIDSYCPVFARRQHSSITPCFVPTAIKDAPGVSRQRIA